MLPSISAQTVYHAAGNVNVTNTFQRVDRPMPLPWIRAVADSSADSIMVFAPDMTTLYLNNAWGTFCDARPEEIISAASIAAYLGRHYSNSQDIYFAVSDAARTCAPRYCNIKLLQSGADFFCTATPAIDDGRLLGVVLTVRRGCGAKAILSGERAIEREK